MTIAVAHVTLTGTELTVAATPADVSPTVQAVRAQRTLTASTVPATPPGTDMAAAFAMPTGLDRTAVST